MRGRGSVEVIGYNDEMKEREVMRHTYSIGVVRQSRHMRKEESLCSKICVMNGEADLRGGIDEG